MGSVPTITASSFPTQGTALHTRARVRFHYGPEEFYGIVVRHDMEAPFLTIIALDNGRMVLGTECQYATPLT